MTPDRQHYQSTCMSSFNMEQSQHAPSQQAQRDSARTQLRSTQDALSQDQTAESAFSFTRE